MNIQQFWSDVFAQRADEIRNTSTPMPAKRGNSSFFDGLTRRGKSEDKHRKALILLENCNNTTSVRPQGCPSRSPVLQALSIMHSTALPNIRGEQLPSMAKLRERQNETHLESVCQNSSVFVLRFVYADNDCKQCN